MALDFLSGLGSLISAGSSVAGMLSRDRKPKGYEGALQAQQRYLDLSDALTNPGNATFGRMRDEEKARSRDALTQAINQILSTNRRMYKRGTVGTFINPDRRDESISRALTQGYQDEDYRAGTRARDIIGRALQGTAAGINPSTALAGFSNNLNWQNASQIAGIGGMVGQGVKAVPDLFNSRNNDSSAMSGLGAGAPSTTINEPLPSGWTSGRLQRGYM